MERWASQPLSASLLAAALPVVPKDDNGISDAFLEALTCEGPSIIEIPVDPDELPRPARLADVQAPQSQV